LLFDIPGGMCLDTERYPSDRVFHTFLFADLVGFTALAELEGDSRALAVALELQRRTAGLLRSHEEAVA
jgi:class 3 adenylate cyclase